MRISLRTMLGTVTAASIALTVLMYLTTDYRRQLAIRSDLQSNGAYSVSFGPGNSIHASFHDPVASQDIAKYREVAVLDFKESHVIDQSLKNLCGLEEVGVIVFSLSDVTDDHLLHLQRIGKVRHLCLSHTELTDACIDAIIEVPELESVDVTDTLITQSGIERIRAARPAVIVRDH